MAGLLLAGCDRPTPEPGETVAVGAALGAADTEGFARALQPREFRFPADHGPHPAFRNEWWYFTGNLTAADGRRFGYQFTLFRTALSSQPPTQQSPWGSNTVWMAHAALTDIDGATHTAAERFSRGAPGLAGVSLDPLRLWLNDWQLQGDGNEFPWQLTLKTPAFGLQLELTPLKPIVLQGESGLSQKSAEPGNASYYYSIPRLQTTGTVTAAGQQYAVQGLSWLDREWSTSALGPEQSGWDWFSLQLDSGADFMFYQLRQADGSKDPFSKGIWVHPDGTSNTLAAEDVVLEPLAYWQSPDGQHWPVRWRLRLHAPAREWIVTAAVEAQLMDLTVRYWEGAVRVLDAKTAQPVGHGYLEMTRTEPAQTGTQ